MFETTIQLRKTCSPIRWALLLVGLLARPGFSQETKQPDAPPDLPLNHFQFIGTHNSYHIAPSAQIRQLIDAFAPGQGAALNYTHRPLLQQLEVLGIRQLELDLYGDPQGGLYANPISARLPGGQAKQVLDERWKRPGFKVFHSPDFDQNTTVMTLRLALRQLRSWSEAHPDHEPVFVLLELKDESFSATKPPPFDKNALMALEAEIREELPAQLILSPDKVRGSFPTLREAVTKRGWPLLSETRGQFIFGIDNEDTVRDEYLSLSPDKDLRGRVCFVSVPPDNPVAAWMKRNDSLNSFNDIRVLVAEGFMVRARADIDLKEVGANDHTRATAAMASGAQWISTDAPEPILGHPDYQVSWPDHKPWYLFVATPIRGRDKN